jgi:hypothetical protein
MMHHRAVERVATLGRSPALTIQRFSNGVVALPGMAELGGMLDEGGVITELSEARNGSDQLM